MAKPIYVLNGPNLNMLGLREPAVYGRESLGDVEARVNARAKALGLSIVFRQSNDEGKLVDWIQEARDKAQGIIINPGAYSHTSIAILDALQKTRFNRTAAAKLLGVTFRSLRYRMERLGLKD